MKSLAKLTAGAVLSAFTLLLLSACATTLAPSYDKAIADGLVSTSSEMMEFFASTSAGTTKNGFAKREGTYNNLIGRVDALVIQANARPTPKNSVTEKVNDALAKRGVRILEGDDAPSATALQGISKTLTKMRDTDKKQGITSAEAGLFKGQAVIYLDQAITYESYLER